MNWLTVTVFVLAWFSIMAIVLYCWHVRVRGFRNARAASIRLARFRTADEAWGDRELRKAEYQLALTGYARAQAARARGAKHMVFDWDKAARRIKETDACDAAAGLSHDWEWTGGAILQEGKPVRAEETYTYLASNHAVPELELDGVLEDCWLYEDETPGWDSDTYWPESALAILLGERTE